MTIAREMREKAKEAAEESAKRGGISLSADRRIRELESDTTVSSNCESELREILKLIRGWANSGARKMEYQITSTGARDPAQIRSRYGSGWTGTFDRQYQENLQKVAEEEQILEALIEHWSKVSACIMGKLKAEGFTVTSRPGGGWHHEFDRSSYYCVSVLEISW